MGERILLACASKCASTAEIAEAIAQILCDAGANGSPASVGERPRLL